MWRRFLRTRVGPTIASLALVALGANRPWTKMPHVGIGRFGAGCAEEHRAEDNKSGSAMSDKYMRSHSADRASPARQDAR
jgi:hypothetical protein